MNKQIAFVIISLFLISLASAVSISPNPITIQQQVSTTEQYSLTINNDHDFEIFDFEFTGLSPHGFNFPNINISPNSEETINFTVNPQNSFNGNIESTVSFKFQTDVPTEITTYQIDISQNGFSENFMVVRKGDSIEFKNLDTIVHKVTTSQFDSGLIPPTESFTYTFNQIGEFDFTDPSWSGLSGFNGKIQVIERSSTENIHNPEYDFKWNLNLELSDKPTDIEVELMESFFEVGALGETEGLMRIKNIGNETATNVKITSNSNWITPNENDFSLNPNQQKFVSYKISPIIIDTEDTNKNYTIPLKIKGLNTEEISKELNVFIPFNDDFDDPSSSSSVASAVQKAIEKYIEFCQNNPIQCGQGTGGNQSSQQGNVTYNASVEDVIQQKRDIAELKTDVEQNTKSLTQLLEIMKQMPEFKETIDKLVDKDNNRSDNLRVFFWISGIFLFFGFVFSAIIYFLSQYFKKQEIEARAEGQIKTGGFLP